MGAMHKDADTGQHRVSATAVAMLAPQSDTHICRKHSCISKAAHCPGSTMAQTSVSGATG